METIDPSVLQLEEKLKEAERRLLELKLERDEARDLVHRMEERVAQSNTVIESWVSAFEMELNDAGEWSWARGFGEKYDLLAAKYVELLKDWNRFVPKYNAAVAPKPSGRPLDASPAQCTKVLKQRKAGASLRGIAEATNLSLQTVRTIIGRETMGDRTSTSRLRRIDPDKAADTARKARRRERDALPRRINETLEQGVKLRKEAKGLGG